MVYGLFSLSFYLKDTNTGPFDPVFESLDWSYNWLDHSIIGLLIVRLSDIFDNWTSGNRISTVLTNKSILNCIQEYLGMDIKLYHYWLGTFEFLKKSEKVKKYLNVSLISFTAIFIEMFLKASLKFIPAQTLDYFRVGKFLMNSYTRLSNSRKFIPTALFESSKVSTKKLIFISLGSFSQTVEIKLSVKINQTCEKLDLIQKRLLWTEGRDPTGTWGQGTTDLIEIIDIGHNNISSKVWRHEVTHCIVYLHENTFTINPFI